MGIGYVSMFAARRGLRSGELVKLFPEIELPAFDSVFVLQSSGGYPSLKLKAFKRHLQEVVNELLDDERELPRFVGESTDAS